MKKKLVNPSSSWFSSGRRFFFPQRQKDRRQDRSLTSQTNIYGWYRVPQKIHGNTPEELSQAFMTRGTFYETKYIPWFIKNKLKVGQKVKIYLMESAPSQDEATLLIRLDE